MLTIFSIPKPFQGHISTIQWNAIVSWTLLRPAPQVILLGEEEGVADVCRDLRISHIPQIERNEHGTPLLNSAILQARKAANFEILCYVNADILLLGGFTRAVEMVARQSERFLAVSKRINVDIEKRLDFAADWEAILKKEYMSPAMFASDTCIDIFAFPRSAFCNVPPFAIGRLWFDHWFIKHAYDARMPVVDLSQCAPLLHQNHHYNHVPGGLENIWMGKEAEQNLKLYGKVLHDYTLADNTHELLPDGRLLKRNLPKAREPLRYKLWEIFVQNTLSVRQRFGLNRTGLRNLKTKWLR